MSLAVERQRKTSLGTWIEISTDRLLSNLREIKKFLRPQTEVMAVVKSNAYGHGLTGTARALADHVSLLGVSSTSEALTLSEQSLSARIFLFGRPDTTDIPFLIARKITLSVSSFEEARQISQAAKNLSCYATLHVKVDTGMGRLGLTLGEAQAEIKKMAALPYIALEGIYTHFPNADSEDGFAEEQIRRFALLLEALERIGIRFHYRHAANSAGCLKFNSPIFNLVRPGLLLYGLYPNPQLRPMISVLPVLSLKSNIILIKKIQAGESVGYGRTFVAQEPTVIAVLPMGYSLGYPYSSSGKAWTLYGGKRCPVAGAISMDYLCVDLGNAPARRGDTITLIGEEGEETLQVSEIAHWTHSIPYEIVTRLAAPIPRLYGLSESFHEIPN